MPRPPMMGELPKEKGTLDIVFDNVGVDCTGPVTYKKTITQQH